MNTLGKLLVLPSAERWLLIKAAFLLVAIKLGTLLLPFGTLRHLLSRFADASPTLLPPTNCASAEGVARAVEMAGRHAPKGVRSCLTEALAAQVLLARRGYPACLRIGVARGEGGKFHAHAWVESEGKIVIGGSLRERFTPLGILEEAGTKSFRQ